MNRPRILIVEDEGVIALDIEESLLSLHYDVAGIAASVEEAFELAEERKPDLVLMDINLSEKMDGIAAADKIKQQYSIPVVFLTGFADIATINQAKTVEPDGYVLKPFRYPELRAAVELALHRHQVTAQNGISDSTTPFSPESTAPVPNYRELIQGLNLPTKEMEVTIVDFLQSLELFQQFTPEHLAALASVCTIENLKSHHTIVEEGAEAANAFLVMSGRVGIYKTSPGGKELAVELLGPSDLFGLLTALEKTPFSFAARTQGPTRLLWIPREVLISINDTRPQFKEKLIHSVLERLRKAHDLSRALAHDRVEVRIASAVLSLMEGFAERSSESDNILECNITRQQISDLAGTTPETVSRVLSRLQAEGVIDLSHSGKVRLLNRNQMQAVLDVA